MYSMAINSSKCHIYKAVQHQIAVNVYVGHEGLYISAVYIRWCITAMDPHYVRGDGYGHLHRSQFISGVVFREKEFTHTLDLLAGRCQQFDCQYYNFDTADARRDSFYRLQTGINDTDAFFSTECLLKEQRDDMRPDFIHHIMAYMRFQLKILDQKMQQETKDLQMTRALLLRRIFYRKYMGVMQRELARRARNQRAGREMTTWKKPDDFFLEPDLTETEENLNWLREQTLQSRRPT